MSGTLRRALPWEGKGVGREAVTTAVVGGHMKVPRERATFPVKRLARAGCVGLPSPGARCTFDSDGLKCPTQRGHF